MPNYNPKTGIPYGYIAAHLLDPELVDHLMYHTGTSLTMIELKKDFIDNADLSQSDMGELAEADTVITVTKKSYEPDIEALWELDECNWPQKYEGIDEAATLILETCPDLHEQWEQYEPIIEEEVVEGESEGVAYCSSWLGGALNFFIYQSPVVTWAWPCSPCVPGAGDLNTPCEEEKGIQCYGIPAEWIEEAA